MRRTSHLLGVLGAVAGLLVPRAPHIPLSPVEGTDVRLPASPLEWRQWRQLKRVMRKDPEESHARHGQQGLGTVWAEAGHHGCGRALRLRPAAGLGCFSPPGASGPTFPSWSETAERPLPTQTIPLFCEASARAAEGPPTGCSSGLWLSQMSSFSYSSLLEPQFKEWFRWNKIVLGNKVNTLRTFMYLLSPQKAAWTMIIKFAMRVKSWPSLLGLGFSCRHSPLGIYLAWGMIYLASRNLCTVVMNPCFEDAGFRAAVGRCSLPGPIFHCCVLPAHSQEPNY